MLTLLQVQKQQSQPELSVTVDGWRRLEALSGVDMGDADRAVGSADGAGGEDAFRSPVAEVQAVAVAVAVAAAGTLVDSIALTAPEDRWGGTDASTSQ